MTRYGALLLPLPRPLYEGNPWIYLSFRTLETDRVGRSPRSLSRLHGGFMVGVAQ